MEYHPNYIKIEYEDFKAIMALPIAQAGKVLIAMLTLFFEGNDDAVRLPAPAKGLFSILAPRLRKYRTSVLNGMKNKTGIKESHSGKEASSVETEQEKYSRLQNAVRAGLLLDAKDTAELDLLRRKAIDRGWDGSLSLERLDNERETKP